MKRRLTMLWRALLLLALIALTAANLVRTTGRAVEHRQLQAEVQTLSGQLDAQKLDYSGSLAARQQLQTDPEAQLKLLKERMGYARKNEIPIVVTIEEQLD